VGDVFGMQLAWRQGFHHLMVESDSKLILVDMIMSNVKINGKLPTLVHRIQELMQLNLASAVQSYMARGK
jgi:hypothetical protein